MSDANPQTIVFDERRDIIIPGNFKETIQFCAQQFISLAKEAIEKKNSFTVALSGGTTPLAIFKTLSENYERAIDWSKVYLFWSDERSVPPDHIESNYFNAMNAGFAKLPIRPEHIFRMRAETNVEAEAKAYEMLIWKNVSSASFDLVMLGVGDDGHTASLFPYTKALQCVEPLVVANVVAAKNTERMTFTYTCIHKAQVICIYATGASKAKILSRIFSSPYDPDQFPAQKIGTTEKKAYWIMDKAASEQLLELLKTSFTKL